MVTTPKQQMKQTTTTKIERKVPEACFCERIEEWKQLKFMSRKWNLCWNIAIDVYMAFEKFLLLILCCSLDELLDKLSVKTTT